MQKHRRSKKVKKSRGDRQILVPIDFTTGSTTALQQALALSGDSSRIIALHVVSPASGVRTDLNEEIEQAKRHLEDFCGQDNRDGLSPVELVVKTGTPFCVILECAQESNAEMIVLAVHESRGLGPLALGHTADRVSRYAKCPVLLVRDEIPASA